MDWRDDGDVGPIEVRRVATEPTPVPPDPEESALLADEHDGWQPVRPRRTGAPPRE